MVFFRKRKKRDEDIEEIKNVVEGKKIPEEIVEKTEEGTEEKVEEEISEEEVPVEQQEPVPEVKEKPVGPGFAPLFVKIDRYKVVLDFITSLKNTIFTLKSVLEVQKQIEELKNENKDLLASAIDKIDKQIQSLDTALLRPKGFEEVAPPPVYETGELDGVIGDLKRQIEGLKSELKTIT